MSLVGSLEVTPLDDHVDGLLSWVAFDCNVSSLAFMSPQTAWRAFHS